MTRKRSPIKRARSTEFNDEKLILAFAVMNDEVCKALYNHYKSKQLKLKHISQSYKRQFKNVFDYYKKYEKSPKRTITIITDQQKAKLDSDEISLDEQVLETIGTEYALSKENYTINHEYIIQEVIPRFLNTRKITELSEKLSNAVDKSDPVEAENILKEYEYLPTFEIDETFGFTTPLTLKYQLEMIKKFDFEGTKEVYRFPGALHSLIGPLKREWLVAISGSTKASKSYFAAHIGIDAVLNQKRKVLYLCPEMSEEDMNFERIVAFVTNMATTKELSGINYLPVFDCIKNQTNTCTVRRHPRNIRPLLKQPVTFNPNMLKESLLAESKQCQRWRVCTRCRGTSGEFIPAIFFKKTNIDFLDSEDKVKNKKIMKEHFRALKYKMPANFKIKYFPKYQIGIEDCFDVINGYIDKNGAQDIIIFDYLDILRIGSGKTFPDYRDYDHLWKMTSRLAQETKTLIITPDQSTAAGRTSRLLDETTTSSATMKDHHLNVKIGIGKIKDELANNIARVNVIFHRHRPFSRNLEVLVTQNLTCAKAICDTNFWWDKTSPPYNLQIPPRGQDYES